MARKKNPNGANQTVIDPRQGLFVQYYFDPESETFSNALQSALRAGYERDYAKNLTSTLPRWLVEKVEEYASSIPDSLLTEKHLALLNKEEVVTKSNVTTGEVDVIPTGQIDTMAVSKGLDMAYKLKGRYSKDKEEEKGNTTNYITQININVPNTGNKSKRKTIPSVASSSES